TVYLRSSLMSKTVRVAVTGAAGEVAYLMLTPLAPREIFRPDTKGVLQLLQNTPAPNTPAGVPNELLDCGFFALPGSRLPHDPNPAFKDVNFALLVGSSPRKKGQERKDLLKINGGIFVGQGQALAKNAASDVRIHVVGNPCNTNCLVAYSNGRDIPADRWTAMTRLDHNRARSALAKKAGVGGEDVTNVTIWGNHSSTQYPDFTNARIKGRHATEVINDRAWLENTFVPLVQTRGAEIIKKRGLSSAMSAENAALDQVKAML